VLARRVRAIVGCWEDGVFVGAVVFSRGACKDLATRFGFDQTEAVELTRIALARHQTPTTRIVAIALRLLKSANPGLQVVISFSDPAQSHNGRSHTGTVYRAGGWLFLGMTGAEALLRIGGVLRHRRTIISKHRTGAVPWLRSHVDPQAERVITPPKFRFAFPLTAEARERLRPHVRSFQKTLVVECDRGAGSGTRGLSAEVVRRPGLSGGSTREGTLRNDPVAPFLPEAAHA
jgi:hypothetical protein